MQWIVLKPKLELLPPKRAIFLAFGNGITKGGGSQLTRYDNQVKYTDRLDLSGLCFEVKTRTIVYRQKANVMFHNMYSPMFYKAPKPLFLTTRCKRLIEL